MIRKSTAIITLVALMTVGVGLAQASSDESRPCQWVTQAIGNKLSVQACRPVPYALTGDLQRTADLPSKGPRLQCREIGNKLSTCTTVR